MTRERWDETRALIEAGWHSAELCGWCGYAVAHPCSQLQTALNYCPDWRDARAAVPIDTKQAQHDGSRQIYGGLGTPQRED